MEMKPNVLQVTCLKVCTDDDSAPLIPIHGPYMVTRDGIRRLDGQLPFADLPASPRTTDNAEVESDDRPAGR